MDRIDIHTEVPSVRFRELTDERRGEGSVDIKARVDLARGAQKERFKESGLFANANMNTRDIKKHCAVDRESKKILEFAVERLSLSARAYTRILKVARTIADLDGSGAINKDHISEAVQYRSLDRPVC